MGEAKEHYIRVPDPRDPKRLVLAKIVNFRTIKEDWNEYELEDGTIVKTKLIAQSMSYPLDEQGNIIRTPTGEPVVNVRYTVIITAFHPKKRLIEVEE